MKIRAFAVELPTYFVFDGLVTFDDILGGVNQTE